MVAKDFVPVMLYQKKAPKILEKYEIEAFPTFIVIDAEENELMRQVGSPFSTPEEAIEWFPEVNSAIDNVDGLAAKYEENSEDLEVALELADTYNTLGKGEKALAIYKKVVPDLDKEHERYTEVKLAYADALMGTITRENQAEVGAEVGKIYDEVLPGMIEDEDDGAIDPALLNARIKMIVGKDSKAARKLVQSLVEPFADHDRILEIKFFAAYFAAQDGDTETAKKEYKAVIKEGEEDDQWVTAAENQLKQLESADSE